MLKNQFEGGGRIELNDQLFDPDAPTLASQDKLKVSPKGLLFVTTNSSPLYDGWLFFCRLFFCCDICDYLWLKSK